MALWELPGPGMHLCPRRCLSWGIYLIESQVTGKKCCEEAKNKVINNFFHGSRTTSSHLGYTEAALQLHLSLGLCLPYLCLVLCGHWAVSDSDHHLKPWSWPGLATPNCEVTPPALSSLISSPFPGGLCCSLKTKIWSWLMREHQVSWSTLQELCIQPGCKGLWRPPVLLESAHPQTGCSVLSRQYGSSK